ncbi:MAG: acetyl-CoA hydrolase/transferase family protein [Spirochaetota bacterium]
MDYHSKKDVMKQYKEKLCSADEAVKCVKSGDWITYAFFNGKPVKCDTALAKRRGELKDVQIYGAVTIPPIPEVLTQDPDGEAFTYGDFHFSLLTRIMKMQYPDRVSYAPLHFGETDWQTEHLRGPLHDYDPNKTGIRLQDVHIMRTAPMDENGYFNFGISNACMLGWCKAHKVIVEVNKNVPTALGGARESIHVSQIDYIVEGDSEPLFELPNIEATEVEKRIAEHVFKYLYDGCCIQLGIGGMPNTLGHMIAQSDLKNLGGHTEMLVDAFMEMELSGRLDNSRKNADRWKTAYTFALGSKKLYDWINNNPSLASYNVGYVNSFDVIKSIDDFVSINSAIEVDIMGQVNAESNGFQQISGNGGMLDFVLGSFWSKGGKSFICLPSTYTLPDGKLISRIVPSFKPGTAVTVPRQTAQFIATEYGCVNLKLAPLWMRAEKLISIAHPDFREELIKAAEENKIWSRSNKR